MCLTQHLRYISLEKTGGRSDVKFWVWIRSSLLPFWDFLLLAPPLILHLPSLFSSFTSTSIQSFFFFPTRFPCCFLYAAPPPLSIPPSLHSSVFQLLADSIIALLLRWADSLSVLTMGFKHTKSTPERNRYFATAISPFPGEYSLKWYNNWHGRDSGRREREREGTEINMVFASFLL